MKNQPKEYKPCPGSVFLAGVLPPRLLTAAPLVKKPVGLMKPRSGTGMWGRRHDTTLCWGPAGIAHTLQHHGGKARFRPCVTISHVYKA